jgi:transposase-like protein
MKQYKTYSNSFKKSIVSRVKKGEKITAVGKELNISPSTIFGWKTQLQRAKGTPAKATPAKATPAKRGRPVKQTDDVTSAPAKRGKPVKAKTTVVGAVQPPKLRINMDTEKDKKSLASLQNKLNNMTRQRDFYKKQMEQFVEEYL